MPIIDGEADVLIVGAGFAGLTAANLAAADPESPGRRVLVVDRAATAPLNNSRIATGVLHIGFMHPGAAPEALLDHARRTTDGDLRPELGRMIAANAGPALGWLAAEGALIGERDYGKGSLPILQPQRPFANGLDWQGNGADLLLTRLRDNLLRRGGRIEQGVEAIALLRQAGRVTGLVVRQQGRERRIRARDVVLADGGFQGSPALVRRFITPAPQRLRLRATPTATGSALEMAEAVGAALEQTDVFYGHLLSRDAMASEALWPYPNMDSLATAGILVDDAGRRFADEDRGAIWLTNMLARRSDPLDGFAVFDEQVWSGAAIADFVPPNPILRDAGGTCHVAGSLEAVAGEAGIDPQGLQSTVEAYNAALRDGSSTRLPIARGIARFRPRPIERAPFYAVPLCAGITTTMGGIAIDDRCRALDRGGGAIPGLHALGSCTGGYEGGRHAGYLGGLMKAFVTGHVAGRHLARGPS